MQVWIFMQWRLACKLEKHLCVTAAQNFSLILTFLCNSVKKKVSIQQQEQTFRWAGQSGANAACPLGDVTPSPAGPCSALWVTGMDYWKSSSVNGDTGLHAMW